MFDRLLTPIRNESGFIFAVALGFFVGMLIMELLYPIIAGQ